MAISAPHYRCLRELHRRGELPQGGSILEIGEANWYGDFSFADVFRDYRETGREPPEEYPTRDLFAAARFIYELFFRPLIRVAVDAGGTEHACRLDLNSPIRKGKFGTALFETVINHGTAEHIFNIGQVFRTMHDQCAVGGLMIHESPFTGWIDHGFWTIQPTAYFDLCQANGYKLVMMAANQIDGNISIPVESREQIHQMARANSIPDNSMLYVALRKQSDAEFKIPMQGIYDDTLSEQAKQAWHDLRK